MKRQEIIEKAWKDRALLQDKAVQKVIAAVVEDLDQGKLRVAEPHGETWQLHEWIKKAIVLLFSIQKIEPIETGPFMFHDKIKLKSNYNQLGIRVIPPATARYGSFLNKDAVLMPSFVNIGAYVDEGSMIDTWATVGSCAQVGKYVHVSGGVGIGGVLEPVQSTPVIIEDHAFIGSRCVIVEGVRIGKEAVLGANVTLTASTRIIDVTKEDHPKEYRGYIPERSVVIAGSFLKKFPAGKYNVPCALIIGKRKESTEQKISLNEALREHGVNVN